MIPRTRQVLEVSLSHLQTGAKSGKPKTQEVVYERSILSEYPQVLSNLLFLAMNLMIGF